MMRSHLLLLGILVLTAVTARAMIRTLPVPDLVKQSALIVIVKVGEKQEAVQAKAAHSAVRNRLQVEKVLKGAWDGKKPLEVMTAGPLKPKGWIEDHLEFPEIGDRALVFLTRSDKGEMLVVNGIQGVWPMAKNSDKLLKMGFGKTIGQIEEAIRQQGGK